MQRKQLWRITVVTTTEAAEAVAELLSQQFGQWPAAYQRAESCSSALSIYLDHRPDDWGVRRAVLAHKLATIEAAGLPIAPARISLRPVPSEDWAESWKRHFKPFHIGSALLVKPSWSQRRAIKHQAMVVLDPGLSFGTGHHPTTRFCLEQLVAARKAGRRQTVLDLGTGSGILAIAAAKLGYSSIEAIDIDPDALAVARQNARGNDVAHLIRFRQADLTRLRLPKARTYSVICANLISNLLCSESARIVSLLPREGILILAGIFHREFAAVRRTYASLGLVTVASRRGQEWHSASFRRAI